MSIPSNLYAEKIYAEHPIALWALDDAQTYISFISDTNRNVNTWTKTNCTTAAYTDAFPYSPFSDSSTTQVFFNGTGATVKLVSAANINPGTSDTFAIGFYLYSFSTKISAVRVGYQVGTSDPVLKEAKLKPDDLDATKIYDRFWHSISETFTSGASNRKIIIEFDFDTISSESSVLINGVTAGSYSEEFNGTSLGVQYATVPTSLYTAASYPNGNVAYSYGSDTNVGYYLTSVNKTYARNSSTPMVYGSSSSTTLEPRNDMCLILPGMGFLNDSGKHRELSFETWLRVIGRTSEAKRIIGPVASTDGLYVDESFLVLKVGDNYEAHYVGEWDRPMLININLYTSGANVLVNGSEVISMQFDTTAIDFPNKTIDDKDADWIAFYSYTDAKVHVDCVAIYPYIVDTILAKRRFVYAQGVEFPEQLNKAYFGESFLVDYPYTQLGNNYNYPEAGKWSDGVSSGLLSKDGTLAPATYPKPKVSISGSTEDEWLQDTYASGRDYATLSSSNIGHLLFDSNTYFDAYTRAIYGVFSKDSEEKLTDQTLIKIQNKINGSYLEARLSGEIVSSEPAYTVSYVFKNGTSAEVSLGESNAVAEDTKFVAGFDLGILKSIGSSELATFLSSPENLIVYVGSLEDFSLSFWGKVYSVGFTSSQNWTNVSTYFSTSTGLPLTTLTSTQANALSQINTTYTTRFSERLGIEKMSIDTSVSGSWYDTIPLSVLAKTVNGETAGTTEYTLDYIQIDLDASIPPSSGSSYTNTNSSVRAYVHFQSPLVTSITSGLTSVAAPSNNFVEPGTDWETKRYEVVSGTVVKIPSSLNVLENILVVTIETDFDAVNYKSAFIRYLHVAGRSLNKTGENFISSKNGKRAYPYKIVDGNYTYSDVTPISLFKQSMPYFYANGNSGVNLIGDYDSLVDKGVVFRINETLATFCRLASVQAYVKYTKPTFPTTAQTLMIVDDGTTEIKINIVSANSANTRGRIFATLNDSESEFKDIKFFWNGQVAKDPTLNIGEWGVLGFSLLVPPNLDSKVGYLKLTGTALFNNISYYQAPKIELGERVVFRLWNDVSAESWSYWDDDNNEDTIPDTWTNMLITTAQPTVFGISPDLIYKTFTGTDRIIADSDVSTTNLLLNKYQYKLFNNYSTDIKVLPAR